MIQCDLCPCKHHPLMHFDKCVDNERNERTALNSQQNNGTSKVRTSFIGQGHYSTQTVILGTVLVHISDFSGVLYTVRALVDSTLQISAITSECSSHLGTRVTRLIKSVWALSSTSILNVQRLINCFIQRRFSVEPIFKFEAFDNRYPKMVNAFQ